MLKDNLIYQKIKTDQVNIIKRKINRLIEPYSDNLIVNEVDYLTNFEIQNKQFIWPTKSPQSNLISDAVNKNHSENTLIYHHLKISPFGQLLLVLFVPRPA